MKSLISFRRTKFIPALIIVGIVLGCSLSGAGDDKDLKQSIIAISKSRLQFYKSGDSSAWLDHTAEKFISINEDGSIETKADLINDIRNSHKYSDFVDTLSEFSDISFHHTGNTVVLNFRIVEFEVFNQKDTMYDEFERAEVYTFLDGRWQIVISQVTPIPRNYQPVLLKCPAKMISDTGVYLWYNGKADTISYVNGNLFSRVTHGNKEQLFALNDSVAILKDYLDKEVFHHANGTTINLEYQRPDGQSLQAVRIKYSSNK